MTDLRKLAILRREATPGPAANVEGCDCDRSRVTLPPDDLVMCDYHEKRLRHLRWDTLATMVIDYEAALTEEDGSLSAEEWDALAEVVEATSGFFRFYEITDLDQMGTPERAMRAALDCLQETTR